MRQGSGGCLQNFKSIHAKLKKIDLRSCTPCVEIQAMIYNAARVRRLSTQNFKSIHAKLKKDRSVACAVAHLAVEIQAMIYNVARVRRLLQNFKSIHAKA